MTELKPCPFCGSENVYWNDGGWIECRGCNIFFQVAFTNADKEENINWWNTRADRKTEPQTCSVNGRPYTDCCNCEHFKCTADELQTERPCDNCQEWDCYGCDYKQTERSK